MNELDVIAGEYMRTIAELSARCGNLALALNKAEQQLAAAQKRIATLTPKPVETTGNTE